MKTRLTLAGFEYHAFGNAQHNVVAQVATIKGGQNLL
jgi:hypothetical protein